MEFLEFLSEYKKHFPEATSEQVNKAFQISNEHQARKYEESLNEIVKKAIEEIVRKELEESVEKVVDRSIEKAFTKQNCEEVSVSKLSDQKIKRVLSAEELKLIALSIDDFFPINPIDCEPFEWDMDKDEDKQMDEVKKWFKKVLNLPRGFQVDDIHTKVKWQRRLQMSNITLTGGSDISIGPSGTECVWAEVKKRKEDCKECQAIGELMLADNIYVLNTMIVLTDCNDHWAIFYFMKEDEEQCIANCKIDDRGIALAIIKQFILGEGRVHASWTGKHVNYSIETIQPLQKKAKFREHIVRTDDEDALMDIIDEMSETEIINMNARKKLLMLRDWCKLDERPYVDQMIRQFSDDYEVNHS